MQPVNVINAGVVVWFYLAHHVVVITAAAIAAEATPFAAGVDQVANDFSIFNESTLRAWAVIGAVIGSMLAIALVPPNDSQKTAVMIRRLFFKAVASICGGIIITPLVFRYGSIDQTVDMVLSVSGMCSFLTTSLLHKLVPLIEKRITDKINQ